MHVLYLNEENIYVTGGINKNKHTISKDAYIYNSKKSTSEKLQ